MRLTAPTALRGTFALLATAAVVTGLSACATEPAEDPTMSEESTAPEESMAPEESAEAPADDAAEGGLCTAEQMTSLVSGTGQEIPEAALSGATASFEPADLLADLTPVCVATFEQAGITASFAVVPGGAASITTLETNATAAGSTPTVAGDTLVATVGDVQIAAQPYSAFSQETAGFENTEDLIVVVASPGM